MSKGKVLVIIILILLVISAGKIFLFLSAVNSDKVNDYEEKGMPREEIIVSVEQGSTTKVIAEKLEEAGLIKDSDVFYYKCKFEGISGFHYGTFVFDNYMDFNEITDILSTATQGNLVKFLVPEGYTQNEIAEKLQKEGIVDKDEFIEACNNEQYDYGFLPEEIRPSRLEGYLYPDTYFFEKNSTGRDIVEKMLTNFGNVYSDEYMKRAEALNLSTDEVIIIASIIEKEIKYSEERKIAASVIYNRLENNMPLQMDATVLYAKGENKDRVLMSDTEFESEYNTYQIKGLPSGPISNPGKACIEAALYPEKTDYLYYVVENRETGQHYFTDDYNDFLKAKEKYVSNFD